MPSQIEIDLSLRVNHNHETAGVECWLYRLANLCRYDPTRDKTSEDTLAIKCVEFLRKNIKFEQVKAQNFSMITWILEDTIADLFYQVDGLWFRIVFERILIVGIIVTVHEARAVVWRQRQIKSSSLILTNLQECNGSHVDNTFKHSEERHDENDGAHAYLEWTLLLLNIWEQVVHDSSESSTERLINVLLK